ncbi:MAG TPA: alpha-2-macroglobulin family protein, partial [Aggregatilineales bacterium]|nr:alpha-2-macroglobulin family protein [Aggregatilineales bacterium]
DDTDFSLLNSIETLDIFAEINYERRILESTVTLNEFGTFSGEFILEADVPIGNLRIWLEKDGVYQGEINAQVAEFRVPEFSVTVTPAQDEVIAGDAIRAVVNGNFFSGGAVSNATISLYAQAFQTFFNYTGEGRYSFSEINQPYIYYDTFYQGYNARYLGDGQGITDSSGNFIIDLENTIPAGPYPEEVTIEATINDESGQYISGRDSVIIHPADVYVGVRTDEYFGREGNPFRVQVITVSPQSEILPYQQVDLSLVEFRWERTEIEGQFGQYTWSMREIEHEKVRVETLTDGTTSHEFTPPSAGIFIVRAEVRDQRERLHRSGTRIWVTGQTYVWWGQPSNNIDLITDADSYVPGDTAEILVPVSLEGKSSLLVTVERDGVMQYEVIPVEGSTYVYQLPLTDDHAPGVYVSVYVMHGIDADNNVPVFKYGTILLNVEPVSKRLDVTLKPSAENTQPGETITIDVEARNPDGSPAQAEIGLSMVDAAILSLSTFNSLDPEAHYYSDVPKMTLEDTMLIALLDGRLDDTFGEERDEAQAQRGDAGADLLIVTPSPSATSEMAFADGALAAAAPPGEGLGGGGGFDQVTVREDFQQTPLWEPHVVTDANGLAQVSVTLPDNLTVWNLQARGLTTDTLVGDDAIDIASTLPLLVRPA